MQPLLNSRAAHGAFLLLGYGSLAAGLLYLIRCGSRLTEYGRGVTLGSVIVLAVLSSPVSHQHYAVIALPLFWALLTTTGRRFGQSRESLMVVSGAAVLFLLLSWPAPGLTPIAPEYQHGLKSLRVATTFSALTCLWWLAIAAVSLDIRHNTHIAPGDRQEDQ